MRCSLGLLLFFMGFGAFGQQKGVPSPGPTRSNETRPPIPSSTASTPDLGRSTIYVSGTVMMDDGSAPPINTVIERVCNGSARPLGYADQKGHFSLAVQSSPGNNFPSISDASYDNSNPRASAPLAPLPAPIRNGQQNSLVGCEVRASYSGMHSEPVYIGDMRALDNPNIGTLVLRRNTPGGGTTVSASSLGAPKDAAKAYDKAMQSLQKGDLEKGHKDLEKATSLYPSYAEAWYQLGKLEAQHDRKAARAALEKALVADPKYVPPYVELGFLDAIERDWKATLDHTGKGLHLDSVNYPQLFFFNAVANFNLHNMLEAESKVRQALAVDRQDHFPKTHQLLSAILENKGDFAGAAEQMRAYLSTKPSDAAKAQVELSKLEARVAGEEK